ncbi:hypothetical protein VUR80DRAFT_8771 [Thermomyces stellatus]
MDGLNSFRQARVADVLDDFRTLQYYISATPADPPSMEDYYTEGWATLRQCAADGRHILACAADTSVPSSEGGPAEQEKAELQQVLLDAYARRHEGHKIYLRQAAANRWVERRAQILNGGRPNSSNRAALRTNDQQLRAELSATTDEKVYAELQTADVAAGRWTEEDPSLRSVLRWLAARR